MGRDRLLGESRGCRWTRNCSAAVEGVGCEGIRVPGGWSSESSLDFDFSHVEGHGS